MSGLVNLILVIEVIIFLAIGGYIVIRLRGLKDEPSNADIIINLNSDYTDGHALGLKQSEIRTKDKIGKKIAPRDINYIEVKNRKQKIKSQDIFALKHCEHDFPISTHRNMTMILPERGKYLPEKFLKTELGQLFYDFIERKYKELDEKKIGKIREDNLFNMAKDMKGLQNVKDYITSTKKLYENNLGVINETKPISPKS